MESFIVEAAKWLLSKSDPMLIGCFLILALWQWRTSKLLARHLDPQNESPHPQCAEGEKSYNALCGQLNRQHRENREDFQGLSKRIDTVLEITARKK